MNQINVLPGFIRGKGFQIKTEQKNTIPYGKRGKEGVNHQLTTRQAVDEIKTRISNATTKINQLKMAQQRVTTPEAFRDLQNQIEILEVQRKADRDHMYS